MNNKKSFFTILLVLGLAINLLACNLEIPLIPSDEEDNEIFNIEAALIKEETNLYTIDAKYPVIKGFTESENLSATIENNINNSIKLMEDAAVEFEADGLDYDFNGYFNTNYGYFQNENIVSLWINSDLYMGGAHGIYSIDSYTFNTDQGTVYKLTDLFHHEAGVNYIVDIILDEIMASGDDYYFDDAVETIFEYNMDFNFLIDGDMLVIYFPLYDIAPYAAGIMSYEFSCYELEEFLKLEIFLAMDEQVPEGILF